MTYITDRIHRPSHHTQLCNVVEYLTVVFFVLEGQLSVHIFLMRVWGSGVVQIIIYHNKPPPFKNMPIIIGDQMKILTHMIYNQKLYLYKLSNIIINDILLITIEQTD